MYKHLTSEQRYTISVLLANNFMKKDIATAIGVSPSSITCELKRNSSRSNVYNWKTAQYSAAYKKRRRPGNRSIQQQIEDEAINLLTEKQWSPEQISGRLAKEGKKISYETIFKIIRNDKVHGGTLYKNCRHQLKHRRRPVGQERVKIPNRTSIHEHPEEADGKRMGDLELDTIVGKGNKGAIVTIVDRRTSKLIMRKLPHGKNAEEAAKVIVHLLEPYKYLLKTITTDNGSEFFCHEYITKRLGIKVYFADPHAPWQKGLIENTNGLIRQYIPKGTDFDTVSQQKIKEIQRQINTRPRAKLKFLSPDEAFVKNIS